VNGVAATITGMDSKHVTLVDNGVGDYTLIAKEPSNGLLIDWQISGHMMVTAAAVALVYAQAYDRVSIKTFAMDGTTPKDATFQVSLIGTDSRILY
jgi:hypothetical protein